MKTVRFVIGLSHAGKTTARTSHPVLASLPYVDLYDIQRELYPKTGGRTEEEIWRSYEVLLERALEMLEKHDDIVIEHTLVKAHRRPYYTDGIKEVYPTANLICYYVHPSFDTYLSRTGFASDVSIKRREGDDGELSEPLAKLAEKLDKKLSERYRMMYEMFDIPSATDGFDDVCQFD